MDWTLDPDRRAESPTHQQRCTEHHRACSNAPTAAPSAPPAKRVSTVDFCRSGRRAPLSSPTAISRLVDGSRRANGAVYDSAERDRWHAMLIYIAEERGYKAGLGCAQVQRKIRPVSRLGRFARANPTDTGS